MEFLKYLKGNLKYYLLFLVFMFGIIGIPGIIISNFDPNWFSASCVLGSISFTLFAFINYMTWMEDKK